MRTKYTQTEDKRTVIELIKGQQGFYLPARMLFLAYRGSILHGTYLDEVSDRDFIGIAAPPLNYVFGLDKFEQFEHKDDVYDILVYDLKKVVSLLLKSNPNVLELLWIPDWAILQDSGVYQLLRKNRQLFVTKEAYKSFVQYAKSQLHGMMNDRNTRDMGAKRKDNVGKFGYDVKNAACLIMLIRQGIDLLSTGEIVVNRTGIDDEELIAIKQGKYSLEYVKALADSLLDSMKISSTFPFPDYPDPVAVGKLLKDLMLQVYSPEIVKELLNAYNQ